MFTLFKGELEAGKSLLCRGAYAVQPPQPFNLSYVPMASQNPYSIIVCLVTLGKCNFRDPNLVGSLCSFSLCLATASFSGIGCKEISHEKIGKQ